MLAAKEDIPASQHLIGAMVSLGRCAAKVDADKSILKKNIKIDFLAIIAEDAAAGTFHTPTTINEKAKRLQVRLSLPQWRDILICAGYTVPTISAFTTTYIKELISNRKELFAVSSIKGVKAPAVLTKEKIIKLADALYPQREYMKYFPCCPIERVDKAFLVDVFNSICDFEDEPIIDYITEKHAQCIEFCVKKKANYTEKALMDDILKMIYDTNEARNLEF